MKTKTNDEPSRILIVNVNWIGDVLFSTPFIRAVRDAYPDSFIACMIPPRCYEVLERNPNLNQILIYDEKGKHSSIIGKLKFVLELKKKKFDTAFFLHRSFTRVLLAYLMGIKQRIGYYTKKRAFLLTKAIEPPSDVIHKIDYFLNIAKAAGIINFTTECDFFIGDEDEIYIRDLLRTEGISEDDFVAVINPGGNWDPKRWPKKNFARLSDRLIEEFGARIVISGAEKDKELGNEISSLTKKEATILCGKTNLKELAALLKRANLVISNDTGPMHIAVAMQTPTVALFGPTSPRITGPRGKGKYSVIWKIEDCVVPCYDLSCTDNRCMKLITVDDVISEVKEVLKDKIKNEIRQK